MMQLSLNKHITIAYGDGIGHEVMDAALFVLREAGAELEIETIQIGSRIYSMGSTDGVLPSSWESLARTRVFLKGPVVRPDDKQNSTEAICHRFGLDIAARMTQQCNTQPEIAAIGYIGEGFALFEPLQDALPEIAGKNKAHPGAMILAATMLLEHIEQEETASCIRAALEETLKNKKKRIKTDKFAEMVVEALIPSLRANIVSEAIQNA